MYIFQKNRSCLYIKYMYYNINYKNINTRNENTCKYFLNIYFVYLYIQKYTQNILCKQKLILYAIKRLTALIYYIFFFSKEFILYTNR